MLSADDPVVAVLLGKGMRVALHQHIGPDGRMNTSIEAFGDGARVLGHSRSTDRLQAKAEALRELAARAGIPEPT
jgi:hypothetical protein